MLDEVIEQSVSYHIGEHETLSGHYLGFAKSELYQIDLISFFKRLTVYTDIWEVGYVIYLSFRKDFDLVTHDILALTQGCGPVQTIFL